MGRQRGLPVVLQGLALAAAAAACAEPDTLSPRPVDAGGESDDSGTLASPIAETRECGGEACTLPEINLETLLSALDVDASVPDVPEGFDVDALTSVAADSLVACCTKDRCGVSSAVLLAGAGCVVRDQPGAPDDGCPTLDLTIGIMGVGDFPLRFRGCCREADGECGFDLTPLGVGCMDFATADAITVMGDLDLPLDRPIECR